jgi:glyoxylase-like metal-dependent hydrolase (beta-lactamase superfamily II)
VSSRTPKAGRRLVILAAAATAVAVCAPGGSDRLAAQTRSAATRPAPAPSLLTDALAALGPELRTIRFSGFGSSYTVGQNPAPESPWPRVTLKRYDAAIDYTTGSMLLELVREGAALQPRGGGRAFTGEQRHTHAVRGTVAWDVAIPPAAPGPAGAGRGTAAPEPIITAAPAAVGERRAQIALTPHGFLRSAVANKASLEAVRGGTQVSFAIGATRFEGWLNTRNQLERTRTWIDNPVLGDMAIENAFSGYEKFGLVSFPSRILQRQGGHPALDMFVTAVTANEMVAAAIPAGISTGAPAALPVEVQSLGDGIHYLRGGSHHSVAIEMADHIVLVEAPLDEARADAILAALTGLAPSRPVRVVVSTHHHFDHAGGLRRLAGAGAAIVTQAINAAFYTTAWSAPRTLAPDALSRSGNKPVVTGFADRHTITDGRRTIEVHRIAGSTHHEGLAVVYLPAEKLLIEADVYTPPDVPPAVAREGGPGPAAAAPSPPLNPVVVNFYDNIQRLKLDVATIVPLHGSRTAPLDEVARAAGR